MGDKLQAGKLAKISFSIELCTSVGAIVDYINSAAKVRSVSHPTEEALNAALMSEANFYGLNTAPIAAKVIVEDVPGLFIIKSIVHHPTHSIIGSILFPNCGSIYENVKVALREGRQTCPVLHPLST